MILYHAVSIYQLLVCIVYKTMHHCDQKAVLLMRDLTKTRLGDRYNLLVKYFNDIIIYGPQKTAGIDELQNRGYKIDDFTEIYVACAHTWFGIYLCEHNIPFIFMEDGAGAISQPEILEKVNADTQWIDKDLEYGLFNGENSDIVKCICNMNHQREGYINAKAEHFDVIQELNKLDHKADIIAVFTDLKDVEVNGEKKNVVFLTEHLANLALLEWEEQIYLYQVIFDYYFKNTNLIIKPHPDDLMYYEDLIENCKVIREKFPSELLPLVFSKRPECLATVTSTGIRAIRNQFQEVVTFNYQFSYYEKEFYFVHRYFAAVHIYENNCQSTKKLVFMGVNRAIVDNMKLIYKYEIVDSMDELKAVSKESFIVCDKLDKLDIRPYDLCRMIDEKVENSIFLFLNSGQSFMFYDYYYKKIWDYAYPVEIRKIKRREMDVYENLKPETIYFFHKGGLSMQPISYSLENTGVDIVIEDFKGDKLRIKVLEGLLEATEQRLMQYIEAEKEQKKAEEEKKETVS